MSDYHPKKKGALTHPRFRKAGGRAPAISRRYRRHAGMTRDRVLLLLQSFTQCWQPDFVHDAADPQQHDKNDHGVTVFVALMCVGSRHSNP
jgi:hypothetical protein